LPRDLDRLLAAALDAARRAGAEIMAVYGADFAVRRKDDASPVTLADERAEAIILEALAAVAPEIPVIAEEQAEIHGLPPRRPSSSGSSTRSTAPRSSSTATASLR